MAKRGAVLQGQEEGKSARKVRAVAGRGASAADLDNLIHGRYRLGIMSALATNQELSFSELKALLKTSDGNLSVHARKLEDAEYVRCRKSFDGRIPRTEYRITARGQRALNRYLNHMEALIEATKIR